MLTKEQAMTAQRFHYAPACTPERVEVWRRNGRTQTWKTRPEDFRVPVKYGLYAYGQIMHHNAHDYHAEDDCPHGHVW